MTTQSFEDVRRSATLARKASKSTRAEWKPKEPSAERDKAFKGAVDGLDDAVRSLEQWGGSAFDLEAKREIGDCLGAKGGVYRDWEKYEKAALTYDEGLKYERAVEEMGGRPNSYCLVQRLVMRVLSQPAEFLEGEAIMGVDMREALVSGAETVRRQMEILRGSDPWAQADLALTLLLLGERSQKSFGDDAAVNAWDELDDMRPDRFVYDSTCEVAVLIQKRLAPFLDEMENRVWSDVVERLTRH